MVTELQRKIVKCRKRHQCAWCGQIIEINESAQYSACVDSGDFWSSWFHPECDEACCEVAREEGGEIYFSPGDYPRGSTEGY